MTQNIIVYTNPKVLEDKLGLCWGYWDLANKPKRNLEEYESIIYFATKGFVRGGFLITDIDDRTIYFEGVWEPLAKPRPCKAFQGFKYSSRLK